MEKQYGEAALANGEHGRGTKGLGRRERKKEEGGGQWKLGIKMSRARKWEKGMGKNRVQE